MSRDRIVGCPHRLPIATYVAPTCMRAANASDRGHVAQFPTTSGEQAQAEWKARWDRYAEAHPELAESLTAALERRLPEGWDADLPTFSPQDKAPATRADRGARQVPSFSTTLEQSIHAALAKGLAVHRRQPLPVHVVLGLDAHVPRAARRPYLHRGARWRP